MQYLLLDETTRATFLTPALLEAQSKLDGQGHRKVLDFCKHAAGKGYDWAWIDTVCIDKSSSAELSEAINSMYKWYESAECCYVYLWDVRPRPQNIESRDSDFQCSEWWRRGWTLQELLAPKNLEFLDFDWRTLGTKTDLAPLIRKITGIDLAILLHETLPSRISVSNVLYWAARRETSRVEDTSYCLMGLFGVNMPLLYGEGGPKAFRRLCTEIIQSTFDDSVLFHSQFKTFASSPAAFVNSFGLRRHNLSATRESGSKNAYMFMETWKQGIRINNALYSETPDGRTRLILLRCRHANNDRIFLRVTHMVADIWITRGTQSLSHKQRAHLMTIFDCETADDKERSDRFYDGSRGEEDVWYKALSSARRGSFYIQ